MLDPRFDPIVALVHGDVDAVRLPRSQRAQIMRDRHCGEVALSHQRPDQALR
ncbi:MAG TPA: hypothetical protein VIW24_13945 [Aldersonia sp.]